MVTLRDVAIAYQRAGLAVLPARRAEKRPTVSWKQYQTHPPTEADLQVLFANEHDAICILCGRVSGNCEIIDFDAGGELFPTWLERISPELCDRLVIERTPSGGYHVCYRCDAEVCGNMKLSQRRLDDGKIITLIETRGEGGLFICAPTPGYQLIQGSLCNMPVLTADERDHLLQTAWELNEYWPPVIDFGAAINQRDNRFDDRPGDIYNANGDVRSVLQRHGVLPAHAGMILCPIVKSSSLVSSPCTRRDDPCWS